MAVKFYINIPILWEVSPTDVNMIMCVCAMFVKRLLYLSNTITNHFS